MIFCLRIQSQDHLLRDSLRFRIVIEWVQEVGHGFRLPTTVHTLGDLLAGLRSSCTDGQSLLEQKDARQNQEREMVYCVA